MDTRLPPRAGPRPGGGIALPLLPRYRLRRPRRHAHSGALRRYERTAQKATSAKARALQQEMMGIQEVTWSMQGQRYVRE